MANEKRLIDANALQREICGAKCGCEYEDCGCEGDCQFDFFISNATTVESYTGEQLRHILNSLDKLEAENKEMRTENVWLKSCLNCKIRKECPRHCGKVVHGCDHWEYGDSTVDAVEVVRCKDCIYATEDDGFLYCDGPIGIFGTVGFNDFCSYGERKDNGKL